ncbi:MAG TPA: MerR family transcriptional regulator [Acidimicrobiales bacterium]|nr:MerR family transcriptional regulator [Acidimicrobiales bacterium]
MSYRGPQVCSIVGITYRQLDYWTRTKLIRPSVADAKGSGSQRLYSYGDLLELKVIKSLLDAGFDLRKVRRVIDYVRQNIGDDVAAANLVITGGDSVVLQSGEELVDLLRNGQGVLNIVPLGGLKTELEAQITELHPSEPADVDDDDGRMRAAR